MDWQNLLLTVDGALWLELEQGCANTGSACPVHDVILFILDLWTPVEHPALTPGSFLVTLPWAQHIHKYPVGYSATGRVSEESGECCTLREQTAPELVMDPHCTEKQAHLQLGPQIGRERREEELALGPWEPPAPLGHSSHPSCQEAIYVSGEHSGMQHPSSNVRTKTLNRGMFSG